MKMAEKLDASDPEAVRGWMKSKPDEAIAFRANPPTDCEERQGAMFKLMDAFVDELMELGDSDGPIDCLLWDEDAMRRFELSRNACHEELPWMYPDAMLLIFEKLESFYDLFNCRMTCRSWRDIINKAVKRSAPMQRLRTFATWGETESKDDDMPGRFFEFLYFFKRIPKRLPDSRMRRYLIFYHVRDKKPEIRNAGSILKETQKLRAMYASDSYEEDSFCVDDKEEGGAEEDASSVELDFSSSLESLTPRRKREGRFKNKSAAFLEDEGDDLILLSGEEEEEEEGDAQESDSSLESIPSVSRQFRNVAQKAKKIPLKRRRLSRLESSSGSSSLSVELLSGEQSSDSDLESISVSRQFRKVAQKSKQKTPQKRQRLSARQSPAPDARLRLESSSSSLSSSFEVSFESK